MIDQPQHVRQKLVARLFIVAIQRAVAHRLGNVASAGKISSGQRRGPVRRGVLPAMFACSRIVVFDFEVIAARLFEIDRISEMGLVRRGDAFDLVLRFVIGNVFVRLGNFFRGRDAKTIMVGVRFIFGIRSALVNHQTPRRIRMFDDRLLFGALDDFARLKDR